MARSGLKNVHKASANTEGAHGIYLDITHKEFAVLVGTSGCDKSTTLRMIAGLDGSRVG